MNKTTNKANWEAADSELARLSTNGAQEAKRGKKKTAKTDGTLYDINVERQGARNLTIPFRTLNIRRFSLCGDDSSQKSCNFVL